MQPALRAVHDKVATLAKGPRPLNLLAGISSIERYVISDEWEPSFGFLAVELKLLILGYWGAFPPSAPNCEFVRSKPPLRGGTLLSLRKVQAQT